MYRTARSHVDNLARTTGETTTLYVEEDGRGICVYMALGTDSWSPDYVRGEPLPLHVTAPGKALLAAFDAERVDDIVQRHGLPQATEKTISDRSALESELRNIRESGFAFSREEQFEGIVEVGSAFGLKTRAPAAAISVCGPLDRLTGRYLKEDIIGQVISTAKSIQVDLTK